MNLYYISNSVIPSREANSIHCMKMCHAYAALGHRVTLIVPDWKKGKESGVEDVYKFYGIQRNFAVRKIPLLPGSKLDFVHRALLMPLPAFRGKSTLVHSRGITSAWGLTQLFHLPTIFELHQPLQVPSRMHRMFVQTMKSKYLKGVIFITRALQKHTEQHLPREARSIIAPDGVDSSWLKSSVDRENARKQLGIQTGGRQLAVYAGHLYPGRGIELIIELSRHLPEHLFLIVGGTEVDIRRHRELAPGLTNLIFEGFKPPAQIMLYLQAADVLLMPYANKVYTSGGGETTDFASPMKMFEYMAAARPIVASNLPVVGEVLQDGRNALLRSYDQPESWIEALKNLQKEKEWAEQIGTRARGDVVQYTWESRAARILEEALPLQ